MGTSALTNGLMTQVDELRPTTNLDYQTASSLRRPAGGGSTGEARILVYFARPFPLGATITSAKLVLYSAATAQTGTVSIDARRIQAPVSFAKVTWATRPTALFAGVASVSKTGPIALQTMWEIDITAMMQSVALGDPWYGLDLSTTTIVPAMALYDSSHSLTQFRPRLEVTWSDAPDKPRTLAPSGGRAVSVAKPILRCDYVDVSGATEMQSIQVQISPTSDFTSPAFDSGTVATSTPELDLSTTAYAGLTDGQVVYWRARVRDMAGLWSVYSDPVSFTRDGKGTLTLTSPSSGTPIVEDSTPPISWTLTGETQASYQLAVTGTLPSGQVTTWSSGKITSAATTVTLPAGVLTSPDAAYQVTLRVWDAKQRETTPGDPAYAEVVRNFTLVPSASVSPTTAATATSAYPMPKVTIGWTRSTDPDSFTVLRNRRIIASGLIPGDVRVSGSTFAYLDAGADPQTTLLYEVLAVVNGKASSGNSTVTTTLSSAGIWLADAARTNEVMITGRAERSVGYGEESEVLSPVGASEIVLVTRSLRGIEGTVTGELHSGVLGLATTAQQWRDRLLAIKAKPGRKCWLTLGDVTIQCVVRSISIQPRAEPKLSYAVSFEFYQTGPLQYVPTL